MLPACRELYRQPLPHNELVSFQLTWCSTDVWQTCSHSPMAFSENWAGTIEQHRQADHATIQTANKQKTQNGSGLVQNAKLWNFWWRVVASRGLWVWSQPETPGYILRPWVLSLLFFFKAQGKLPGFQKQKMHRNGTNSVHKMKIWLVGLQSQLKIFCSIKDRVKNMDS